jgi:hypothetical protein
MNVRRYCTEYISSNEAQGKIGKITYYFNANHIYPPYTSIAANEDAASIHAIERR